MKLKMLILAALAATGFGAPTAANACDRCRRSPCAYQHHVQVRVGSSYQAWHRESYRETFRSRSYSTAPRCSVPRTQACAPAPVYRCPPPVYVPPPCPPPVVYVRPVCPPPVVIYYGGYGYGCR